MIRFEHIRKEFPDATPIKDVCGELESGKVYTIIGPSGTGKSTLLRMINGLGTPTSGKIYLDDLEITAPNTDITLVRKNIGMVFQHFNLFNHLTIEDNLIVPQMDILGRDREEATERARVLLSKVGLERTMKKFPSMISGGQKQRVAIARTLAMDPKVILFDEPTSALDPNMTNEVRDIILSLKDGERTMIIVTHDMEFAETVSDEVIYLDEGIIYERGTPHEIFHEPKNERTIVFVEQMKMLEINANSDDFDYDSTVEIINNYCSQLKLSFASYNNMVSVMEELVVEKLCHQNQSRLINYATAYDVEGKCMYYSVRYNGDKYNPLSEDNCSTRILKNIIRDIEYSYSDDKEYTNVIKFRSKMI